MEVGWWKSKGVSLGNSTSFWRGCFLESVVGVTKALNSEQGTIDALFSGRCMIELFGQKMMEVSGIGG